MKRTIEIDRMYNSSAEKAINRFFRSHPELDYWKETFLWMNETGTEFFSDTRMNDGTKNKSWCYALHLDTYDGTQTYIAIIERQ